MRISIPQPNYPPRAQVGETVYYRSPVNRYAVKRSVAYCAIWDWLADVAPADIMPLLCEECTEELLADYDITHINEEDTISLVKEMLDQGLDPDTAAALCRGFKTMNKK